ncbi:hypothetical protein YPF_4144 [Yersinia pestis biovar Orientalis str. India 195]|nr:hypothetical protein YPF_4144 [Yersinia pestis biovar Orientalis str. India 195]EEO85502.1 hypothetical protein YPH_1365 [Yersinia pestis biovar Orientalis str. PEXU2]EEO88387.1 hypothetical protein YPS_4410 [Yersinia pestis Pestoides A]
MSSQDVSGTYLPELLTRITYLSKLIGMRSFAALL